MVERRTINPHVTGPSPVRSVTLLFRGNIFQKGRENIKLISEKDFKQLLSDGIIAECHMPGNNPMHGEHSSGYYDKVRYDKYIYHNCIKQHKVPDLIDKRMKLTRFHVGVVKTRSKIYIEDGYTE